LVIRVTICFPVFILLCSVLLLMRPPPRSPLFPYTTLFRSQKFVESFSSMGASGFSIRYLEPRFIFRNNSSEVEDKTIRKEKKSKDRKSTRLNSSHVKISYAVFCLKKKKARTKKNNKVKKPQ